MKLDDTFYKLCNRRRQSNFMANFGFFIKRFWVAYMYVCTVADKKKATLNFANISSTEDQIFMKLET